MPSMPSRKNDNEEPAVSRLAYQTYLEDLDDDLRRLLAVRRLDRLFVMSNVSPLQRPMRLLKARPKSRPETSRFSERF